jgi:predicted DNA-binding transcriptional regulator AlpA
MRKNTQLSFFLGFPNQNDASCATEDASKCASALQLTEVNAARNDSGISKRARSKFSSTTALVEEALGKPAIPSSGPDQSIASRPSMGEINDLAKANEVEATKHPIAKKRPRGRHRTPGRGDDPGDASSSSMQGRDARPPQYLSVKQVAARYEVGVATIWRWVKADNGFPAPVRLSTGVTRWLEADLLAFEISRRADR